MFHLLLILCFKTYITKDLEYFHSGFKVLYIIMSTRDIIPEVQCVKLSNVPQFIILSNTENYFQAY